MDVLKSKKRKGTITMMYNEFPSERETEILREEYPAGTVVELITMDDPYIKLVEGDRGTVQYVDDAGQIHIRWDKGSSLALIPGVDSFRKL